MTVTTQEKFLVKAIEVEIEKQVHGLVVKKMADAKAELDKEVAKIVATVSLQVFKLVSYERLGPDLVIRVKMEGGSKNEKE